MKLDLNSKFKLNDHREIPFLGLGVWQIADGKDTINSVTWALEAGYRHIDTAKIYGNEKGVGEAVRNSGLKREDIWVTTKLFPGDFFQPTHAFEASLKRLDVDYVDLYLVHWPPPLGEVKLWEKMEELHKTGKAKSIGVSNFSVIQIQKILDNCNIPPAVNQIKMSPWDFDPEMEEFLKEKNIALEAYSPLTRTRMFGDPTLVEIADKYKKTPAQILIRWCLEHGYVVIPKSSNQGRIKENADVFDFEIEDEDLKVLDNLSK